MPPKGSGRMVQIRVDETCPCCGQVMRGRVPLQASASTGSINLFDRQWAALDALAKESGVKSRSEVIRRLIDGALGTVDEKHGTPIAAIETGLAEKRPR